MHIPCCVSNDKDKYGVNKIIYNWDYNEQERENLYTSLKLLAVTAKKYSWGRIQIREQSLPDSADILKGLSDAAHPSGGTRISNNPKYGVVNSNLKVHFTENLYVCGSSIFPTNGHEPPTYTIVAFAARLAMYLEKNMKG